MDIVTDKALLVNTKIQYLEKNIKNHPIYCVVLKKLTKMHK